MLPLRVRVNLGAMAMKGILCIPPKRLHYWSVTIECSGYVTLNSVISRTLVGRGSLIPPAEKRAVYFTVFHPPAVWTNFWAIGWLFLLSLFINISSSLEYIQRDFRFKFKKKLFQSRKNWKIKFAFIQVFFSPEDVCVSVGVYILGNIHFFPTYQQWVKKSGAL